MFTPETKVRTSEGFSFPRELTPAILSPEGNSLTFAEFEARIESVACDLRALGVDQGDIVAVVMPETPDLLAVLLGTMRVAAAAPLDATLTETELRTRLELTSARCLVTGADSRAAAAARAVALPVVEVSSGMRGPGLSGELSQRDCLRAPLDTALILQTSATTAAAKLVPLTHRNLGAICDSMRRGLALRPTDVYLSFMPLHHIAGFSCTVGQLLEGGRVVYAGAFDALAFAPLLERFQPTWYVGGPAIQRAVLQLAKENPERFARNSLRFLRSGTGAASPVVLDELERALNVTVVNGYGLTEVGVATNTIPHLPRKPGSVGRSSGIEIGIKDRSGSLLPPGSEGEVVLRGDAVMHGYLDDPDANREALRGGWFHTGDLGRLDEDGDLFITGRIKEIINRGGESIAPIEIDHALAEHPAVAMAAAFAVPHSSLGEDVAAAVVLRAGVSATAVEIRNFLAAGRLSRARIPSQIVFTDSIPVSATGKPLRKVLSERFAAALAESRDMPAVPEERRIAGIWAGILGRGAVGVEESFFALGGDSLSAVVMLAAVQKELNASRRILGRVDFFDAPTVRTLARIVAECGPEENTPELSHIAGIPLQPRGSAPPLFCFPSGDNLPYYLRHLAESLGSERPFIVLYRPWESDAHLGLSVAELAERSIAYIKEIQPHGPYTVGGHCFGGVMAFEVARQLAARGDQVSSLVLFDSATPGYPKVTRHWTRYFREAPRLLASLGSGAGREIAAHMRMLSRLLRRKAARRFGTSAPVGKDPLSTARAGLRSYIPGAFPGKVFHYLADDEPISTRVLDDPRLAWREFAQGGYEVYRVRGGHFSMFTEENAPALAARVREVL